MKKEWFKNILKSSLPAEFHNEAKFDDCLDLLSSISSNAGGEIYNDSDLDESLQIDYAILRINQALVKQVNSYIPLPHSSLGSISYQSNEPLKIIKRVSVNYDGVVALASLPEIGDQKAEQIIKYRTENGFFTNAKDLAKVPGISEEMADRLKYHLSYNKTSYNFSFNHTSIQSFREDVNLSSFVNILNSGILFASSNFQNNILEKLKDELDAVSQLAGSDPFLIGSLRGMRASEVKKLNTHLSDVQSIDVFSQDVKARLVFKSQYANFAKELIDNAKTSIQLAMFFLLANANSKAKELLDAIIAAKARSVDIKVILDKDDVGDPYLSREINMEAFKILDDAGIAVIFDEANELMHAKTLVVDEQYVIVGSHNWTGGSFHHYEDISILLESKDLSSSYKNWIENLIV